MHATALGRGRRDDGDGLVSVTRGEQETTTAANGTFAITTSAWGNGETIPTEHT